MAYLTSERKTQIESDLARVNIQITALENAMTGGALSGTTSYSFDSGSGRQQESFNSPLEMIEALDKLEAKRNRLQRLLGGTSIIRIQSRR